MGKIFVIDDDSASELLREGIEFRGHEVTRIPSAKLVIESVSAIADGDLAILDIIMEWPTGLPAANFSADRTTGMMLLKKLRELNPSLPVLIYSATNDPHLIDAIGRMPNTWFVSKWNTPTLRELVDRIENIVNGNVPLAPFIVHGHDTAAKLALKNYLQNTLGLPEPLILHELPNCGRTVIEKFEDYAGKTDLVFVLLTPDDRMADQDGTNEQKRRARQNVIFELGYFMGALKRNSGRVLLLYKPPLDLPSDLSGVIYVDISNGVEAAGEEIRRELRHVRQ